uniref:Uncharacterized protein n=6 Tax=Torrey Pines virus TaxID=1654361 RepID=A0A2Z4QKW9_9REOV|nr:hypothetical protein [Torrey Pines virus]
MGTNALNFLRGNKYDDRGKIYQKMVQQSAALSTYSDVALMHMDEIIRKTPFLPQISSLTPLEFDRYFNLVSDNFGPEVLAFGGRAPICSLEPHKALTLFTLEVNKSTINLTYRLTAMSDTSYLLAFTAVSDDGTKSDYTISTTISDMVQFELLVVRAVGIVPDSLKSISDADNLQPGRVHKLTYYVGYDIYLVVYQGAVPIEVDTPATVRHNAKQLQSFTGLGDDPMYIKKCNLTNVLTGLNVYVNLVVGSTLLVVDTYDTVKSILNDYVALKNITFEADCHRMQSSMLKMKSQNLMTDAARMVETDIDQTFAAVMSEIGTISSRVAHSARWVNAEFKRNIATILTIKDRMRSPYYVPKNEVKLESDTVIRHGPVVTRFKCYHSRIIQCKMAIISNLRHDTAKQYDLLPDTQTYEDYIMLSDSASTVSYLHIRITDDYTPHNPSMVRTYDYSDLSNTAFDITFTEDGYSPGSGSNITATYGKMNNDLVMLKGAPFKRSLTLLNIIVCDKRAITYPDISSFSVSGELVYMGQVIKVEIESSSALDLVTREYGSLKGVALRIKPNSTFERKMHNPTIHVPNHISIILKNVGFKADWGMFFYNPQAKRTKTDFGSDNLFDACDVDLVSVEQSVYECTFDISVRLNNRYYDQHYYFSNMKKRVTEGERKERYLNEVKGLSDDEAIDKYLHTLFFDRIISTVSIDLAYSCQRDGDNALGRVYMNMFSTDTDKMNSVIMHEIAIIKQRIDNIDKLLLAITDRVNDILKQIDPTFARMIVDTAISMVGGVVATKLFSLVASHLSKHILSNIDKLRDLARVMLSVNLQAISKSVNLKHTKIPLSAIGAKKVKLEFIKSQIKDGFKLTDATDHLSKQIKLGTASHDSLCKLQNVDDVAKIMLCEAYSKGVAGLAKNAPALHSDFPHLRVRSEYSPMLNAELGAPSLPTIAVYYRPLDCGMRVISDTVYKALVNPQRLRYRLLHDSMNLGVRAPGHSYAVFTDRLYHSDGSVTMTKIFTGIGELNIKGSIGSDFNSGIGGVCVKYKSLNTSFDQNGKRLYSCMSYTDCGYSKSDVISLHATFFKTKTRIDADNLQDDECSRMWQRICQGVDKRIVRGDEVYNAYVPDRAKFAVVRDIIDNPPAFNYNLLNNNCQTYTKDLVNYMKSNSIPATWSISAIERANRLEYDQYSLDITNALDDTTALIRKVRTATVDFLGHDHAIRLISVTSSSHNVNLEIDDDFEFYSPFL